MTWQEIVTEQLRRHEGVRPAPYLDPIGKITIGIGRNLTDKPLKPREIEDLYIHDLADAEEDARHFLGDACFEALTDNRKAVIVNMAFNLGYARLARFTKMLGAIKAGRYDAAAEEMLASKWAGQVNMRAVELSQLMRSG